MNADIVEQGGEYYRRCYITVKQINEVLGISALLLILPILFFMIPGQMSFSLPAKMLNSPGVASPSPLSSFDDLVMQKKEKR